METRVRQHERTAARLLERAGTTYAEEAGVRLRDAPAPLYRLLVLTVLLSARINAGIAVKAAQALASAGARSPSTMQGLTWRERVDALAAAGYRRYDERTATALGNGAQLVQDRWRGDLRRLRAEADGDVEAMRRLLREVPGIGPLGSAVFCREVQGVWPEVAPFADDRVLDGARTAGLPAEVEELARLVPPEDLPRLVAACVRVSLDATLADDLA